MERRDSTVRPDLARRRADKTEALLLPVGAKLGPGPRRVRDDAVARDEDAPRPDPIPVDHYPMRSIERLIDCRDDWLSGVDRRDDAAEVQIVTPADNDAVVPQSSGRPQGRRPVRGRVPRARRRRRGSHTG